MIKKIVTVLFKVLFTLLLALTISCSHSSMNCNSNFSNKTSMKMDSIMFQGIQFANNTKEIFINHESITSLEGIERFVDLEKFTLEDSNPLSLVNHSIHDLSPLWNCKKLKKLQLSNCDISSLTGIDKLINLKFLDISSNPIHDVSPLKKLKLEFLDISDTEVSRISEVNGEQLKYFNANGARISDIGLFDAEGIEEINFSHNDMSNFSFEGESRFLNASSIDLSYNPHLKECTDLIKLPHIKNLILNNTKIEDIGFLASFKSIGELWLDFTSVKDLSVLSELSSIDLLSITQTGVRELPKMRHVRELFLNDSELEDVSSMSEIKGVESINLSNTSVKSIHLPFSTNLKNLFAQSLKLHTVRLNSSSINTVSFANSIINDWSFLGDIKNLKALNLSGSNFQNLNLLSQLDNLKELELADCQIENPEILISIVTNLDILNISSTNIPEAVIKKIQDDHPDLVIKQSKKRGEKRIKRPK